MLKSTLAQFVDGRLAKDFLKAALEDARRTSGGSGDVGELDGGFRVFPDVFAGEGDDTRRACEVERREAFDDARHAISQDYGRL